MSDRSTSHTTILPTVIKRSSRHHHLAKLSNACIEYIPVPGEILEQQILELMPATIASFLEHIVYGRQTAAQAMLIVDLRLANAHGDITDFAGRTFRNITGLQYAIWALDIHMIDMIRQFLTFQEQATQVELFYTGSWITKYGEHANWQNLIDAYHGYINHFGDLTIDQLNTYWITAIGNIQRTLPFHVLQEFCRQDRSFYPCPTFTETEFPRRLTIKPENLGNTTAIMRAHIDTPARYNKSTGSLPPLVGICVMPAGIILDCAAMTALLTQRMLQCNQLIALLTLVPRSVPARSRPGSPQSFLPQYNSVDAATIYGTLSTVVRSGRIVERLSASVAAASTRKNSISNSEPDTSGEPYPTVTAMAVKNYRHNITPTNSKTCPAFECCKMQ